MAKSPPSLVSLARVVLEEAKGLRTWGRRVQCGLLGLGMVGVAVQAVPGLRFAKDLTYACAVVALALQCVKWLLQRRAGERHALGNAIKRRAILIDALGPTSEHADVRMLRDLAGAAAEAAAGQAPKGYYESKLPVGLGRLRADLMESAFFTHSLARLAARGAFTKLGLTIIFLAAVAVAGLFTAGRETGPIVANGILAFLTFLIAADHLGSAIGLLAAAAAIERIERRIDAMDDLDLQAHMAAFADYEAATALAPAIPTALYEKHRDRLDRLWRDRRGQ